jgi:hypothetical protein
VLVRNPQIVLVRKSASKVGLGSGADENRPTQSRPLLRAKQTFSVENRTSDFECLLLGASRSAGRPLRESESSQERTSVNSHLAAPAGSVGDVRASAISTSPKLELE